MEFLHSFPRGCAGKSDPESIQQAIATLGLFLTYGPLLIPEVITIPPLKSANQSLNSFPILQNRFCFTVYEPNLIADHMSMFGPLSITFDYKAVVLSGAMPVFYFPSFESTKQTNDLGVALIHRLRLILSFLQNYRELKYFSKEEIFNLLKIKLDNNEYTKFNRLLAAFDQAIEMDEATFKNMEGTVHSISELFYPTDRSRNIENAKLQYFAQREWRLLSDLRLSGKEVTEYLDAPTKETLLNLNFRFFSADIEFQNHIFKRIDLIQKLTDDHYRNFIDSITGIYVEPAYRDAVLAKLEQIAFECIVHTV